ncbi:dienelactone hydrolase family protein [Candidatus Poribacteria bacterium]
MLGQHPYTFRGTNLQIDYLLFLPDTYNEKPDVEWPVILYFHGADKSRDTVEGIKSKSLPGKAEAEPDFPFIVVSPHFPTAMVGPIQNINAALKRDEKVNMDSISTILETVIGLLDDVISTYRVDKTRVYATGTSQGGYVTWHMATAYPERLAAVAPMQGGGDPEMGCKLKSLPVWIFHGALDTTVPLREAEEMVKSIEECGGSPKLTVYPGAGHGSAVWSPAYSDPELYTWFRSNLILDGIHTSVQPRGKLTTTWGSLKRL